MGFSPGRSKVIIRKSRCTFLNTAEDSSLDLSAPDASADLIMLRGGFQTHCSCLTIASLTCVERRRRETHKTCGPSDGHVDGVEAVRHRGDAVDANLKFRKLQKQTLSHARG